MLFASGMLASVAGAVECNVEKIFHGPVRCAQHRGQAASDPGVPWASSDPVTRATWGTYVALGDAYSAGEGLGNYQAGSHVNQSQCRISVLGHCVYHKDPRVIDEDLLPLGGRVVGAGVDADHGAAAHVRGGRLQARVRAAHLASGERVVGVHTARLAQRAVAYQA